MSEYIKKQSVIDVLIKERNYYCTNRHEYANLSHDDRIRTDTLCECIYEISKLKEYKEDE